MTKAVLCDMGGVLVHLVRDALVQNLTDLLKPLPRELVEKIAFGDKATKLVMDFEAGRIHEEQYLDIFENLFDRRLPRKAYWTRVHTGPEVIRVDHKAVALLGRIKRKNPNVKITLTTNIDPVRLKYCHDAMGFAFDHVVPSFRVCSSKPEAFIYKAALSETGALAADSMFWDDRAENVHAASELGICAYRFTDVPAMERVLTGFNLI